MAGYHRTLKCDPHGRACKRWRRFAAPARAAPESLGPELYQSEYFPRPFLKERKDVADCRVCPRTGKPRNDIRLLGPPNWFPTREPERSRTRLDDSRGILFDLHNPEPEFGQRVLEKPLFF